MFYLKFILIYLQEDAEFEELKIRRRLIGIFCVLIKGPSFKELYFTFLSCNSVPYVLMSFLFYTSWGHTKCSHLNMLSPGPLFVL